MGNCNAVRIQLVGPAPQHSGKLCRAMQPFHMNALLPIQFIANVSGKATNVRGTSHGSSPGFSLAQYSPLRPFGK